MTNTIGIVWTSEQRELIADFQKRQVMLEKEVQILRGLGNAGKQAGTALSTSFRGAVKDAEILGTATGNAMKRAEQPLNSFISKTGELRKLMQAGKMDADQFARGISQAFMGLQSAITVSNSGLLHRQMSDSMSVAWNAHQTKIIQDFNKRQEAERREMTQVGVLGGQYRSVGKSIEAAMGRASLAVGKFDDATAAAFRKSEEPIARHMQRLRELRALMALGVMDAKQLAQASQQSMQKLHVDSGGAKTDEMANRLKRLRSEYETAKRAAREFQDAAYGRYRGSMDALKARRDAGDLSESDFATQSGRAKRDFQAEIAEWERLRQAEARALSASRHAADEYKKLAKGLAKDPEIERSRASQIEKSRKERQAAIQEEINDRKAAAERVREALKSTNQRAFEEYKSHMSRLREQRRTGDISETEFKSAWKLERDRYNDAIGLTEKRRQVERRAAADRKSYEMEAKRVIENTTSAQEKHNAEVAKLKKLLQANLITQEHYQKAVKLSEDGMRRQADHVGFLSKNIGNMVASWISVHSLTTMIAAQLAAIRDRQKAAGDVQAEYGRELFDTVKNLGPNPTDDDIQGLDKRVRGMAGRQRTTPLKALRTVKMALATRTGGTVDDAYEAAEAAVGLSDKEDDQQALARSFLTWKDKYPDRSMKQIVGETIRAQQLHPSASNLQFAEHVGPQIAISKIYGDQIPQATALAATIAGATSDVESRYSTNAMIALQERLQELMPEVKEGTLPRLNALQTDKYADVRKKLLGSLDSEVFAVGQDGPVGGSKSTIPGERKSAAILRMLVSGDADTFAKLNKFQDEMPANLQDAEGVTAAFNKLRRSHPLMGAAELERIGESDVAIQKLGDKEGLAGISREILREKIKAMGGDVMTRTLNEAHFEFSSGLGKEYPVTAVRGVLEKKADALEADRDLFRYRHGIGGGLVNLFEGMGFLDTKEYTKPATSEDLESAKQLRELIDKLQPLLELEYEMKKQELEKQRGKASDPKQAFNTKPVNVQVVMPGYGERPPGVPAAGLIV